jgi:hypothetical protein
LVGQTSPSRCYGRGCSSWHCALVPRALLVGTCAPSLLMATGGVTGGNGTGRNVASHASAGCLNDDVAGALGRGTSLSGSVLPMPLSVALML